MNKKNPTQATFVLVHAAWLGAWQWDAVAKLLTDTGYSVKVPDLPGHGNDKTPASTISMETYLSSLYDCIAQCEGPVILVGHSFNGITISQFAEIHTKRIRALVYLAGFLLPNGGSFLSAVSGVEGSVAVENFYLSEDESMALVREDAVHEAFAHDAPLEAFKAIADKIVPEPVRPLQYPLLITKRNFGSLPAFYIECTKDKAVPLAVQKSMHDGRVEKVYSIESSHTPNFSQPQEVAEILMDIASRLP